MKKKAIVILAVIALIASASAVGKGAGDKYLKSSRENPLVEDLFDNMDTVTNTYCIPVTRTEVMPLTMVEDGKMEFSYAADNLIGDVALAIKHRDGDDVFTWMGKTGASREEIQLAKGDYELEFTTAQWGYLKLGYKPVSPYESLIKQAAQLDVDHDGLPDDYELEVGTDPGSVDTDGDSLTDYDELMKYGTSPVNEDTDGDGQKDSEWDERREFSYSIQAVVDLRPPFNIEEMNDSYQDARIIGDNEDGSTKCEVIVYPNASAFMNPGAFKVKETKYTESTYTKNYDDIMVTDLTAATTDSETDLQALYKVLEHFRENSEYIDPVEDLGYGSSLPILFNTYRDETGQVVYKDLADTSTYTLDEIKDRIVFANSMYELGLHGACGSTSVLKGAMMRAGGLEERTIFTIPLMFSYDTDKTEYEISAPYNYGHQVVESNGGASISDHFYHEVKIGGKWVRVDTNAQQSLLQGLTTNGYPTKIYIKLLNSNDITDDNYHDTWNYETWNEERGYIFRSVIESYGSHMTEENDL